MSNYWFGKQPMAASRPDLAQWNQTFMQGGYYRVDLSPKISILALNTLMFNVNTQGKNADPANATLQLDWLEQALKSSEPDHRFILTFHIYAGTQLWKNANGVWNQWNANYTSRYSQIIRDNHDKVILEVAGHDHIGDLRYSDQKYAPENEKNGTSYSFHNIIIAPSITLASDSLPGYTVFKLDEQTSIAKDLKMVFFPV